MYKRQNVGAKRLFDLNDGTSAIRRGRRFVASNALGGLKQTGSLLEDFGTRIRAPRSTLPYLAQVEGCLPSLRILPLG